MITKNFFKNILNDGDSIIIASSGVAGAPYKLTVNRDKKDIISINGTHAQVKAWARAAAQAADEERLSFDLEAPHWVLL